MTAARNGEIKTNELLNGIHGLGLIVETARDVAARLDGAEQLVKYLEEAVTMVENIRAILPAVEIKDAQKSI